MKDISKHILYVTDRKDVIMSKGKGMYLWDISGKKYLDFVGGWAVNALGHSPYCISKILSKQSKRLINASPGFYNRPMLDLADLLTEYSCFNRVFFASTGAEANESAIKLVRKYGCIYKKGAYKIITMEKGFHGRTLATMSASGKTVWKDLFEPKVSGFIHVPLNDFEDVKKNIDDKTCAVMLELVQGEGGVYEADKTYVKQLRRLCNETETLLVFDEIQTGLGRTGSLFAYEQYDIEPDIMTLGKGIGGGFPLSAMLCKESLNIFKKGEQGGTYSGQPLAMAVGYTVVNEIIKKKLYEQAEIMGQFIQNELKKIEQDNMIDNVRGKGLLIAFDIKKEDVQQFADNCFKKGLIINVTGSKTVRLIPPLIVKEKDIINMIHIIKDVLLNKN